jgi:hypothetical protein
MTKLAVAALARLLPNPGAIPLSTGENLPNSGMSQSKPSRKWASPYPKTVCQFSVFAFVTVRFPYSLPSRWLVEDSQIRH